MHFSWSEIISIISLVLSIITVSISVYIFVQRRFNIKIVRQRAFIFKNMPTCIHLLITITNKSSLPISIIDASLNKLSVVHKSHVIEKQECNNETINKIETTSFPLNIDPYKSQNLRIEFDSKSFSIKNYNLVLITSRGVQKFELLSKNISYDAKNIDLQ